MASPRRFQLHIKSNLNYPRIEDDNITYGPLAVLKLEAGKTISVQTGVWIVQCEKNGIVVILPSEEYSDQLVFKNNKYGPNDRQMITIEITNTTKEFVRIDTDDYLFKYQYQVHENESNVEIETAEEKEEVAEEKEEAAEEVSEEKEEAAEEVAEEKEEVAEEKEEKEVA